MGVRITVHISDEANKKLRAEQTRQIIKTKTSTSASKVVNDLLMKLC